MGNFNVSLREITPPDIERIINYWMNSEPAFLVGMGVDLSKVPPAEDLRKYLTEPLSQPYEKKNTYCLVWLADDEPIGHSNVNKIIYGEEAYMHLHIWKPGMRKKGTGTSLVKMSLPYFFKNLKLKKLYCEPYALNPAPNHTLKNVGFDFVKNYITVPGWINFEQPVNQWMMTVEKLKEISA